MGRRPICDGDCLNCKLPDCVVDRTRKEYISTYMAARYRERKAAGLCIQCGKRPAMEGHVRCGECAGEARAADMEMQRKRKAAGLCTKCGGPRDNPARLMCMPCRLKVNAQRIVRYEKLRAAGLCTQCGKAPARPGRKRCEACAREMNEYTKARSKAIRMKAKEGKNGRDGEA